MIPSPETIAYPDRLEIVPLPRSFRAFPPVPGSKSITNRALVLAALAGRGRGCELRQILRSEDTEVMIDALLALGFGIQLEAHTPVSPELQALAERPTWSAHVGSGGDQRLIPAAQADLFVANSGTTMRFLAAMVALGEGRYRLDGVPRMRQRPIEDLLEALRQLGVRAVSENGDGCPPVVIESDGLNGGRVRIKGETSSQFLSGLLLAAPLARDDIFVEVEGHLVSRPYVAMTLALVREFGGRIEADDTLSRFHVPGRQQYRAPGSSQHAARRWFTVEPDASAASYFFGAAALFPGEVCVPGLGPDSLQGDIHFVDVLEAMGCNVERARHYLQVRGGPLTGVDVDMNAISDCVMTLAAVACFAQGPTTIRNVAHIRHKETDRLHALATELRRLGAGVVELPDGLTITPGPLHGAEVDTYADHRMAMSLALIGLRVPGVVIKDPGCVAKTYPNFFADLEKLRC
jgi:3-phosphoshikimate 1-carboxyvinyltransferase